MVVREKHARPEGTPRDLDFESARTALRRGAIRATELVASCLDQIEAREQTLHAWVELHAERAQEEAQRLDAAFARGDRAHTL